ncbi:uncharacterized protein PAC_15582 [Phialocephala subalpina]|uniref:Uncharacterized protein n=1 Tax=Phialocephala subalpina TaxID=576137 RepID=A0A1L7XKW8_9HELO|nr:uncharacterized protein PAC_15582 [Phialocephala subalpina]
MSFSNFEDAAISVLDKFEKVIGKSKIPSIDDNPQQCAFDTYHGDGDQVYWVVLWREGSVDYPCRMSNTLYKGLMNHAWKGESGGTEDLCGGKWMFEKLDHSPPFWRDKKL